MFIVTAVCTATTINPTITPLTGFAGYMYAKGEATLPDHDGACDLAATSGTWSLAAAATLTTGSETCGVTGAAHDVS